MVKIVGLKKMYIGWDDKKQIWRKRGKKRSGEREPQKVTGHLNEKKTHLNVCVVYVPLDPQQGERLWPSRPAANEGWLSLARMTLCCLSAAPLQCATTEIHSNWINLIHPHSTPLPLIPHSEGSCHVKKYEKKLSKQYQCGKAAS